MQTASSPILLVINSDNCFHCRPLMEDRLNINNWIHEQYPEVRCLWLCLDRMDFSIFPPMTRQLIEHVPIVIYFPRDVWVHWINSGGDLSLAKIMNAYKMQKYGNRYCLETIQQWLKEVVLLEEVGDCEMRQQADELCDGVLSQITGRSTELIDYSHDPPRIIPFGQYRKEQTLDERFRNIQQTRNQKHRGTLTSVPEMYDEPEFAEVLVDDLTALQQERNCIRLNEVNRESSDKPEAISFELTHDGVLYSCGYDMISNIVDVKIESQFMKVLMAFDLSQI